MSDIPSSLSKIQIEGTQFRAPVSESMLQSIGGSVNGLIDQDTTNSAKIAYIINALTPVGSIIHSMLTEAQFQSQANVYGTQWILAAGQTVTGSDYHTITGNTTVPDLRGIILRGKNNGRSGATGNSLGDLALGTYQADGILSHNHNANVTDPQHSHSYAFQIGDLGSDHQNNVPPYGSTGAVSGNSKTFQTNTNGTGISVSIDNAGDESRPRNVTTNIFIRIN